MSRYTKGDLLKEKHQTKICGVVAAGNVWELQEVLAMPELALCDMLEFRHDYFEDLGTNTLGKALHMVRSRTELPLLYTFRVEEEGGQHALSVDEVKALRCHAVESGLIDLIDLEHGGLQEMEVVRRKAREAQVLLLTSYHNLEHTPDEQEILGKLKAMASEEADADIVKAVYPAKDSWDLLTILSVSEVLKTELVKPFVLLSMGEEGIPSRYLGPVFGSFLTYASLKAASAPGQLTVPALKKLLDMHRR